MKIFKFDHSLMNVVADLSNFYDRSEGGIIRRSIALLKVCTDATKNGQTIAIIDSNNKIIKKIDLS